MKRIAVLIAGLPRFSVITTQMMQSISNQFIDYQVDWFFYLWNQEGKPTPHVHESWLNLELTSVIERLKAKLPLNHQLAYVDIGIYKGEYHDPSLMLWESCAPQFLAILRADKQRQIKEKNENFIYDIVIKTRPDILFDNCLIDKCYHPNTILVERIEWWDTKTAYDPSCVQDKFAAGRSEDMTEYTNMIEHIQTYRHLFLTQPIQTEILLAGHLKMRGKQPFMKTNFNVSIHRSEDFNGWED
jgi:hypothetical protein